jgi:hypothetical protein
MAVVNAAGLDTFKGKDMSAICPLGFDDATQNHCAHFVCHVLKLNSSHIGLTCEGMVSGKKKFAASGACIRVHQLFNYCENIAVPAELGCLIFITKATNVDRVSGLMGNIPDKHVGIYFHGDVWNYSNDAGMVLHETKAAFINRVDARYHGNTVVKYTVIPDEFEFLTLSQVQALPH